MQNFDVVIVGYGPTGEVLAAVLGKAGHRVAVVERWPTLYGLPRLTHIDDEAARIVQAIADVDHALRDSAPIESYTFYSGAGEVLVKLEAPSARATCGYARDISIFQPDIDGAINDTVKACPNVTLFLGHDAVDLQWDGDGATLTAGRRDAAGGLGDKVELRGRFVVGCDGAKSFVREAAGLVRTDHGFNERWCTIDVERLRPLDPRFDHTVQFCDPERGHMHMAIGTKRARFELALLEGEDSESFLEEAFAWRWLRERHGIGPEDVKIIRHIVYTFEARIADTWRKGPVLLAGDAAHTMPPYLGQGACSGMRDGFNLGWKLDLILRGLAAEALLDTYQVERKPHVTTITLNAIMLGKIANEHDPERARARDEQFRTNPPRPPETPHLLGGLLAPDAALAGRIWPQAEVRYQGRVGRFDTVVGAGFVLLSTEPLDGVLGPKQQEALARIGCHVLSLADPEFEDLEGVYENYFRDNGVRVLLTRPDFAIFGSAPTLAGAAHLTDLLMAGLAGEPIGSLRAELAGL